MIIENEDNDNKPRNRSSLLVPLFQLNNVYGRLSAISCKDSPATEIIESTICIFGYELGTSLLVVINMVHLYSKWYFLYQRVLIRHEMAHYCCIFIHLMALNLVP